MIYLKEIFLNKEVKIYPGDTEAKYGIVTDINQQGVTFLITARTSSKANFKPGQVVFIAFSAKLNFTLV